MKGLVRVRIAAALVVGLFSFGAVPSLAANVQCGQVITQDTKLDNDLINCPGDGLRIEGNDLTLDLNGHTIDGIGQGYGVSAGTFDPGVHPLRITVENGLIQDFGLGFISHGGSQVVRNLRLIGNGIELFNAGSIEVLNNLVSGGGIDSGFGGNIHVVGNTVLGGGISFFHSGNNTVDDNVVVGNAGNGISVDEAAARVTNNEVRGNGGAGIWLHDGGPLVEGNTVAGNRIGIEHFYSAVQIEGNSIFSNDTDGISTEYGGVLTATNNSIHSNGSNGIKATAAVCTLKADSNSIYRNGAYGILFAPSSDCSDVTHRISRNAVGRNGLDGIKVWSNQGPLVVDYNVANRNGDDGIDIQSLFATVISNKAVANSDLGIEVGPAVTDGGGNKASGNGNPLQCVNVFCK